MTELLFLIFIAICLGLIGGLLPGVGNVVIMISLYPMLTQFPPEFVIIFYAVLIQTTNFSSSVSAINLGLLGDITSEPALRERAIIIKNNLSKQALKYTAMSSVYACFIAILIAFFLLEWISNNPVMLRSEIRFFLLWTIILAIIWWPENSKFENFFLLVTGILLTLVGHYENFLGQTDYHFLTFNLIALHGGIPLLSVLTAFLAVPSLIKLYINQQHKLSNNVPSEDCHLIKYSWGSTVRGSMLGAIFGLIPMIGAIISSNVAWSFERLFSKNKTELQQSINRLISAESANNSSNVTVLLPLLLFGLAIIPSELILLSIIESKAWVPNLTTWNFLNLDIFQWIVISLLFSCLISYLVCYTFVYNLTKIISQNMNWLSLITMCLILISLIYSGMLVNNQIIYLTSFGIFSLVVLIFRNVDYMPLVVGFLLGDQVLSVSNILHKLYF